MTWLLILFILADACFAFIAWKEKSLLALGLLFLSLAWTIERFGTPH